MCPVSCALCVFVRVLRRALYPTPYALCRALSPETEPFVSICKLAMHLYGYVVKIYPFYLGIRALLVLQKVDFLQAMAGEFKARRDQGGLGQRPGWLHGFVGLSSIVLFPLLCLSLLGIVAAALGSTTEIGLRVEGVGESV